MARHLNIAPYVNYQYGVFLGHSLQIATTINSHLKKANLEGQPKCSTVQVPS